MNVETGPVRLFVCGDVMTGRGIDQILRHPGKPWIPEEGIRDAGEYVRLAERVHGPIPRGVGGAYLWRNIAHEWRERRPRARICNLETAITRHPRPCEGKAVNYRMHPRNIDALTSAGFDICALANNHILDWGREGLADTIESLRRAGIRYAGAGRNLEDAMAPAIMPIEENGACLLLFSVGLSSSGIPPDWAAGPRRPGVFLLDDLGERSADLLAGVIRRYRKEEDLVVLSIHWGGNWGMAIEPEQREFARRMAEEEGVALIHGHSSHHPRAVEFHQGKAILHGCGDFINDYEGIGRIGAFRSDLSLMWFLDVDAATHRVLEMEVVPLHIRRFQLQHAGDEEARVLLEMLNAGSADFGTRFERFGAHAARCFPADEDVGVRHAV